MKNYLENLAKTENGDLTDKGMLDHGFVEVYDKFFNEFIDKPIKILEIGIYNGGSLGLWYDYFTKASIFGIDIVPKNELDNDRITTYVADQSDRNQLGDFINKHGGQFDIIIDDGGHSMAQQQVSFGFLFQYINPGGYYVIEDLHTSLYHQHPEFNATESNNTLSFLINIFRGNKINNQYLSQQELDYISTNASFVNLFSRMRNSNNRSITGIIGKKCHQIR